VLALNEVKSILKVSGESYKNAPDHHHGDEGDQKETQLDSTH
jgi:hypothetical protein